MDNLDNLSSCLLDLHGRGILSNFLINFDSYKTEISLQNSENIIVALLNIGELLSYEPNFLLFSDRDYAIRLIYYSINSETDPKKKKSYILNALNKTTAVSLPLYLIGNELDDIEKKKTIFVFDKDDINDLKSIGLKLIHNARINKSLEKSPNLARILYLWQEWENLNTVKEWLDILFKANEGVVQFLRSFTMKSYSQTLGSHAVNIRWKIDPATIEKLTSFDDLIKKVKLIDVTILSEDEQRSVEAALEAWNEKKDANDKSNKSTQYQ